MFCQMNTIGFIPFIACTNFTFLTGNANQVSLLPNSGFPSIPLYPSISTLSLSLSVKPIITPFSINWFEVSVPVPSIENLVIDAYSPLSVKIPDPQLGDLSIPSEPSNPDYEKFKQTFYSFEKIYLPVYKSFPSLQALSLDGLKDFNPSISIPQNDFEFFNVDLTRLVSNLNIIPFNFNGTNGAFLEYVGIDKNWYFDAEWDYLSRNIRDFLSSIREYYSLSNFLKEFKVWLSKEKLLFRKYLLDKERDLLNYKLFSQVFELRVKYREQSLKFLFEKVRQELLDTLIKNKVDFEITTDVASLELLKAKENLQYIQRKISLVKDVSVINKVLLDIFRMYNKIYVVLATLEALRVERERLLVEKMINLQKIEEARSNEQIVQKEREVLLEKDKIIFERINILNAEIERLTAFLESAKKEVNISYNKLLVEAGKLDIKSNMVKFEGDRAYYQTKMDLIDRYLSSYSQFVNVYLRVQEAYLRKEYGKQLAEANYKHEYNRIISSILGACAYVNETLGSALEAFRTAIQADWYATTQFAQAQVRAKIIESESG